MLNGLLYRLPPYSFVLNLGAIAPKSVFRSSFPVVDQLDGVPAYHRFLAEDLRGQGKNGGDVGTSYHESEHPRRKMPPTEPYVSH